MANATTVYSEVILGDERNWRWPVRFDRTGGKVRGSIGIDQYSSDGKKLVDRILLSPAQMTALVEFVGASR